MEILVSIVLVGLVVIGIFAYRFKLLQTLTESDKPLEPTKTTATDPKSVVATEVIAVKPDAEVVAKSSAKKPRAAKKTSAIKQDKSNNT